MQLGDYPRGGLNGTRCLAEHRDCFGNCDLCWHGQGGDTRSGDPAIPVDAVVVHRECGRGVVLDGDAERIVVLFDDYGYRTLDLDVVRAHDLLETA